MAMVLRSLSSSACRRLRCLSIASFSSSSISTSIASNREISPSTRLPFTSSAVHPTRVLDCSLPLTLSLRRSHSATTTSQLPPISDPDIASALRDLMDMMSWDDIPDSVIKNTKKALSKTTDDKIGQEALAKLFRAAEASVEFGLVLISLRMALDKLSGVTGESVGRLPDYLEDAMKAAYNRYVTYVDCFGPDEAYLRKKVESELGIKMIHLKMRCSIIGSEWGKINILGTSGISGSYVEQRA